MITLVDVLLVVREHWWLWIIMTCFSYWVFFNVTKDVSYVVNQNTLTQFELGDGSVSASFSCFWVLFFFVLLTISAIQHAMVWLGR